MPRLLLTALVICVNNFFPILATIHPLQTDRQTDRQKTTRTKEPKQA